MEEIGYIFVAIVLFIVLFLLPPFIVHHSVNTEWRVRIIEAELGEWQIDPKTGEQTFIIFTEEDNK